MKVTVMEMVVVRKVVKPHWCDQIGQNVVMRDLNYSRKWHHKTNGWVELLQR